MVEQRHAKVEVHSHGLHNTGSSEYVCSTSVTGLPYAGKVDGKISGDEVLKNVNDRNRNTSRIS